MTVSPLCGLFNSICDLSHIPLSLCDDIWVLLYYYIQKSEILLGFRIPPPRIFLYNGKFLFSEQLWNILTVNWPDKYWICRTNQKHLPLSPPRFYGLLYTSTGICLPIGIALCLFNALSYNIFICCYLYLNC